MKLFGRNNFIGIYDNALSKHECDILISEFEKSNSKEGGINHYGKYVCDYNIKKCRQLSLFFSKESIITTIIEAKLKEYVDRYREKFNVLDVISYWKRNDGFAFMKYETEEDGFKGWHTEHGPGSTERIFAWMFYLNDAKSGTDFMYYPNVRAKRGRFVIWPAGWEYYHRSSPNKGLKYIVTGWGSYDKSVVMSHLSPDIA